jgi:hypothetical protein
MLYTSHRQIRRADKQPLFWIAGIGSANYKAEAGRHRHIQLRKKPMAFTNSIGDCANQMLKALVIWASDEDSERLLRNGTVYSSVA